MNILGISCYYHDAAAALLRDGQLIAAAEEERFTRVKHDFSFPKSAIQFCLDTAGIRGSDVDYVAFFEKPFRKFLCSPFDEAAILTWMASENGLRAPGAGAAATASICANKWSFPIPSNFYTAHSLQSC